MPAYPAGLRGAHLIPQPGDRQTVANRVHHGTSRFSLASAARGFKHNGPNDQGELNDSGMPESTNVAPKPGRKWVETAQQGDVQ